MNCRWPRPACCRTTRPHHDKGPHEAGLFQLISGGDQAAADSALILAARRLLWRAALFLWKMPLSATESITGWAILNSAAGTALSPPATALSMAFCTFLMTVRK